MLVEAGKLGLDDPVTDYIPELANVKVFSHVENGQPVLAEPERAITIFHLLTHTSGLAYEAPHPSLDAAYDNLGDGAYDLAELMGRFADRPLFHQPGADWVYGQGQDVLGRVIEVVTGRSVDDYLEMAIFGPLGMVDSGFWVRPEKIGRLARVYDRIDGRLQLTERPYMDRSRRPLLLNGGGGMVSTALDYLRFCRMLLHGGELDGVRLLSAATVADMTRDHLGSKFSDGRHMEMPLAGQGYGLGVGVNVEAGAALAPGSIGSYWWAGAYNTRFWIDPARELIGILMVQCEEFVRHGLYTEWWADVCRSLAD
jgi:CubicO group peptidase (beta-lactamase class C family)